MALFLLGCSSPDASVVNLPTTPAAGARKDEPPVATNPDIPVEYPPALYQQGIEGRVLLRLYADSTGVLVPESTKVAESSGYPAFDSSAVASAKFLTFAPGRRNGVAVAMSFTQPILFRHPQRAGTTP
ncbi:MAG TPA: energy transducer TonB [Gemmatimonadales bacterium]|nr:energy transducer TonB [Gemmatimonadales bacterium]